MRYWNIWMRGAVGILSLVFSASASAAVITWDTPQDTSDPSDMRTTGSLVQAINLTNAAGVPGTTTVNGVTFTHDDTLMGLLGGAGMLAGSTTGDPNYDALINTLDHGDSTAADPWPIQVGGGNLINGSQYEIQLWYTDNRGFAGDFIQFYDDGNGNPVELDSNVNGLGQYVLGTFTADSPNQTVRIFPGIPPAEPHLNAFQVRELSAGPTVDFTWAKDAIGDWNIADNWNPSGGPPGSDSNSALLTYQTATFGNKITQNRTVVADRAVSLRAITFDNANTYAVAGTGAVHLIQNTGALSTQISVLQGSHEFQANVSLETSATVDVANGASLEFNRRLLLNGNSLTKTGDGTLAISNDVVLGGGTVNLLQGAVAGGGTIGGDVNNTGGSISPGSSDVVANSAVPEPTTWLMLTACMLLCLTRLRQRQT